MKIGVITDIHNNLIALKTVVNKLNELECEKIICCGDIIGIGPFPQETVQLITQIPNLIAVRGNHEKYLIEGMPNKFPNEEQMTYEEMEHHKWEHSQLSKKSVDFLKKLPYRIDDVFEGYKLSVVHYCMDDKGHYINYKLNPTIDDLDDMFKNIESDIILYGHNHSRNICKGDKLYINVGSLGCPAKDYNIARAGIIDIEQEKVDIELIDVKYNVEEVINMIDKINYSDADNIKKYFYGIW